MVYILMYLEYHTVVVLCQFLCFWREIVFGTYVLTIQLWCCVSFFRFWRETVFGVMYVHCVQYSWSVVFLKNDYSVSLFLEKQFTSQNLFLVKSELSITMYLFLVFYKSTSLKSRLFLKNIEIFLKK